MLIEEPGIVATGNEILVIAGDVLPDKSVKNGLVDNDGGKALISNAVALLLNNVHKILATVPDLKSDTGAKLFNTFVII